MVCLFLACRLDAWHGFLDRTEVLFWWWYSSCAWLKGKQKRERELEAVADADATTETLLRKVKPVPIPPASSKFLLLTAKSRNVQTKQPNHSKAVTEREALSP